jgi:hypothetical protein
MTKKLLMSTVAALAITTSLSADFSFGYNGLKNQDNFSA